MLYFVPEWNENKKTYNSVASKFGDTFKKIICLFDNCCFVIKYLSNKDILNRGKKKSVYGKLGLNFYTFNPPNIENASVLF